VGQNLSPGAFKCSWSFGLRIAHDKGAAVFINMRDGLICTRCSLTISANEIIHESKKKNMRSLSCW